MNRIVELKSTYAGRPANCACARLDYPSPGVNDGATLERADSSLHVASSKGEYGPAEDLRIIVDYLIGSNLIAYVRPRVAAT